MKRDALDDLFSRYIRTRDHWTCVRCHKDYSAPHRRPHLACMHLVAGRGKQSTRFDAENCAAGCYGCHEWLDNHAAYKELWFKATFGEDRWNRVKLRAQITMTAFERRVRASVLRPWLAEELQRLES